MRLFLMVLFACLSVSCSASLSDHIPSRRELVSRVNAFFCIEMADLDSSREYMRFNDKFAGVSIDELRKSLSVLVGGAKDVEVTQTQAALYLTFYFEYQTKLGYRVYVYEYAFHVVGGTIGKVTTDERIKTKLIRRSDQ